MAIIDLKKHRGFKEGDATKIDPIAGAESAIETMKKAEDKLISAIVVAVYEIDEGETQYVEVENFGCDAHAAAGMLHSAILAKLN